MSLFNPRANTASSQFVARLQGLIWVLIYGGLLALVLGLFVQRTNDAAGWTLVMSGGVLAMVGCVLIYVRSKMKVQQ